jgi:hypothetical protein
MFLMGEDLPAWSGAVGETRPDQQVFVAHACRPSLKMQTVASLAVRMGGV